MIQVYWKPNCKFCDMAKNLLSSKGVDYETIELGREMSVEYFLMSNASLGIKTVPAIFEDHIYIGGFNELKEKLSGQK